MFAELNWSKLDIPEIKKILNNHPLNINYRIPKKGHDGKTTFHFLCMHQDVNKEIVEILMTNCRADLNLKDDHNMTPFHYLCVNKNASLELLEFCIKNGAEVNTKRFKGALDFAMLRNDLLVIELLYLNKARCTEWYDTKENLKNVFLNTPGIDEKKFERLYTKLNNQESIASLLPRAIGLKF